jgi:molecular chaperone HtpG
MYKVERENYEKFWDDISPFIKFGCLKDVKFHEKVKDALIYKNLEGKYITLEEYVKASKGEEAETEATDRAENVKAAETSVSDSEATEKKCDCDHEHEEGCDCGHDHDSEDAAEEKKNVIYYVTDLKQQGQYINMFKEAGVDALILTHNIDQPFITRLESEDQKLKFQRIDADITEGFKEEPKKKEKKILENNTESMTALFRKVLGKDQLEVKVEKFKNEKISSVMTLSEESRRMQDMMRMYNMTGMDMGGFGGGESLVLNANNQLVKYIITNENAEQTPMICEQLYDLALLAHKQLEPEAMTKFIQRSNEIMMLMAK